MTITKFGHCCLLIEVNNLQILTDPGKYSTGQNGAKDIDVILISHDHTDHLHVESLKTVLANNRTAVVYTNKAVADILAKEGIPATPLEHGKSVQVKGVTIEGVGEKHAVIHPAFPQSANTGFFIGNALFYPGDALTVLGRPVEILALPVAGPWLTLADAIDYAMAIKPKQCFPVHDGILKQPGSSDVLPPKVLEPQGIKWQVLDIEKPIRFSSELDSEPHNPQG